MKTYKQLWSWDMGTYVGTQPIDDHIRITSVHIHPIHSMYPAQLLLTKINLCIHLGVKSSTKCKFTHYHITINFSLSDNLQGHGLLLHKLSSFILVTLFLHYICKVICWFLCPRPHNNILKS